MPKRSLETLFSASRAPHPDVPTPLLGHLTPAQFMQRYWQKKPLLIRQAIPNIEAPLTPQELFELAGDPDAESRLISRFRGAWKLTHGPFELSELPRVKQRAWTLLVQGVNLHNDRARALLDQFRFISDTHLDDLMISYASNGGGVGPHFDSYDVFLLQTHGKRRWRIGAQSDLTLKPGLPLKILQHFEPENEWLLEPGDMLYLPPHIAHDGIAEGECMTCSIGFRAPSVNELTTQFLYYLAERDECARKVGRHLKLPAVTQPAEVSTELIKHIESIFTQIKWTRQDVASFIGCYFSEPKATVIFDAPDRPLSEENFVAKATRSGLRLNIKTMLLYAANTYYINGEPHRLSSPSKQLTHLADARRLEAKQVAALSANTFLIALLHEWYCAGWLHIGEFAN